MYPSLSQAAADDHRHVLQTEAARQHLLALAACCARGWSRVAAWLRDVVRSTQLGPGYVAPTTQQVDRGFFQPCCP